MAWLALALAAFADVASADAHSPADATRARAATPVVHEGIRFQCAAGETPALERAVTDYLTHALRIAPAQFHVSRSADGRELGFTLTTPRDDTDTLHLAQRPEYALDAEVMTYRRKDGRVFHKNVASKAEIALALMQHGDEYLLSGKRCTLDALQEHIGVRQNIALWGMVAIQRWVFPETWVEGKDGTMTLIGGESSLNPAYWDAQHGTVKPGVPTYDAVADTLLGDFDYEIGCLDATKLVYVMAILDYYRNVKKDAAKFAELEARTQGAPFERIYGDYTKDAQHALVTPGRFLARRFDIAPDHWIPGDWGFIRNSDDTSSRRAGYEGNNAVYLGQGYFNNYYRDRPGALHATHFYYPQPEYIELEDHLLEVFHWRFGILENWAHDPRRKFPTEQEVDALKRDPRDGGLLRDVRDAWGDR